MYTYKVPDMTCGHCEKAIRNEMEDFDSEAIVQVDLESKEVSIQSSKSTEAIQAILKEAGFEAQLLTA